MSKTLLISAQSFLKSKVLMDLVRSRCEAAGVDLRLAPVSSDGNLEKAVLAPLLKDCAYWIVGREVVDDTTLALASYLEFVSKYGVGLDNVDRAACVRRGVMLLHRPGVNAKAVAELSIGFMIGLSRNIFQGARQLAAGQWVKNGGTSFAGKTVGIIGYGHVGSALAQLVSAFQCRVLACDILDKRHELKALGGCQVELDELLTHSDFVTLHVPLTEKTLGLLGTSEFKLMKSTSYLINTSRGGVVDETALKVALKSGAIAGAALDVFSTEPFYDAELLNLTNFFGTPHIAGNSKEAVWAMGTAAVEELFNAIAQTDR